MLRLSIRRISPLIQLARASAIRPSRNFSSSNFLKSTLELEETETSYKTEETTQSRELLEADEARDGLSSQLALSTTFIELENLIKSRRHEFNMHNYVIFLKKYIRVGRNELLQQELMDQIIDELLEIHKINSVEKLNEEISKDFVWMLYYGELAKSKFHSSKRYKEFIEVYFTEAASRLNHFGQHELSNLLQISRNLRKYKFLEANHTQIIEKCRALKARPLGVALHIYSLDRFSPEIHMHFAEYLQSIVGVLHEIHPIDLAEILYFTSRAKIDENLRIHLLGHIFKAVLETTGSVSFGAYINLSLSINRLDSLKIEYPKELIDLMFKLYQSNFDYYRNRVFVATITLRLLDKLEDGDERTPNIIALLRNSLDFCMKRPTFKSISIITTNLIKAKLNDDDFNHIYKSTEDAVLLLFRSKQNSLRLLQFEDFLNLIKSYAGLAGKTNVSEALVACLFSHLYSSISPSVLPSWVSPISLPISISYMAAFPCISSNPKLKAAYHKLTLIMIDRCSQKRALSKSFNSADIYIYTQLLAASDKVFGESEIRMQVQDWLIDTILEAFEKIEFIKIRKMQFAQNLLGFIKLVTSKTDKEKNFAQEIIKAVNKVRSEEELQEGEAEIIQLLFDACHEMKQGR